MFNKKKPITEVIEFNKQKIFEEIGDVADRLYAYKDDQAAKDIMRIISLWRNGAVLDVSLARDEKERIALQSRLSVLDDLKHALERDIARTPKEVRDDSKCFAG
jgi:hypothetical protein